MDKFFSIFGKTVGILLIAAGLIGGGIYLGQKYFPQKPTGSSQEVSPTSSQEITNVQSISPTSSQPVKTSGSHVAINAGGVSPFSKYMFSGFSDWKVNEDKSNGDKLTMTQGDYSLTILQAAIGGGGCTFPGEAPQAMAIQLTNPVDILLLSGNPLRRGTAQSSDSSKASYTICQKQSDGSYSSLTDFGAINYTTPLNPDSQTIAQMDAMVGSLQKQ